MKTEEEKEAIDTLLNLAKDVEDNAKDLLAHAIEFRDDWRKGDFQLPKLAQLDMQSMEEKFEPLWESLKAIATHRLKNTSITRK